VRYNAPDSSIQVLGSGATRFERRTDVTNGILFPSNLPVIDDGGAA